MLMIKLKLSVRNNIPDLYIKYSEPDNPNPAALGGCVTALVAL